MIFTPTVIGFTGTVETRDMKMLENVNLILESGLLDASNKREHFKAYMVLMMRIIKQITKIDITRTSDSKKFTDAGELFNSGKGFMILHGLTDAIINITEFKKMYASIEAKRIK